MTVLFYCPGCGLTRKADEGHHLCRQCEGYAAVLIYDANSGRPLVDDATVEAIAALRRGAEATEIDAIWIEQVERLEAEIERLKHLPDPRPTKAEAHQGWVNDDGRDDIWTFLASIGCFRPEPEVVRSEQTESNRTSEPVPVVEPPTDGHQR